MFDQDLCVFDCFTVVKRRLFLELFGQIETHLEEKIVVL